MAENPGGSGGGTSLNLTDRVSGTINKIIASFDRLIETSERVNQAMMGTSNSMAERANRMMGANQGLVNSFETTQSRVRSNSDNLLNAFEDINDTTFNGAGQEIDGLVNKTDGLGKATDNVNRLKEATDQMNKILGQVKNTSLQAPLQFDQNPLGFESMSSKLAKMSENMAKIKTDVALSPVFEQVGDLEDISVNVNPVFGNSLETLEALEVDVIPNFETGGVYDLEPIQLPVIPDVPEIAITETEPVRLPLLFDESLLEGFAPPAFEPIPLELEWAPVEQPEVFLTDGLDRYQQEMASANQLLERTSQSQSELNALARELRASPAIMNDFQSMQNRINALQQSIAQLEPIDGVVSPSVNNQLESLRGSLQSILRTQEEVANGLSDVNTEAANAAYSRLNTQVGQVERQIRENTVAQGAFNNSVTDGTNNVGGLINSLKQVAIAVGGAKAVQGAINLSDTYSQTLARLDMMNDGLQTTAQLQDMVFASAQRSRMEYQATADMVGKLGTLAGDAFGNSQEIVQFAELINKQFTLAGTSAQEASGATLQLTQALASGVLRGDELNSVMEQAPTIIQAIADYLDVSKGEIRELASEGKITADIVKNAMFASADAINEKFEAMPRTWSQVWTSLKNNALEAFEPVLQKINEIANHEGIDQFVNGAVVAMHFLSDVTLLVMDGVSALVNFIGQQWSWLGPIMMTLGALLLVHYGHILLIKTATVIATAAQTAWNTAVAIYNALMGSAMTKTFAIIILVVGAIYLATAAWNMLTGQAVSGLGVIVGAIYVLWDLIINVGIAIINIVLGVINFVVNLFQAGIYAVELLWFALKMSAALVLFGILFVAQSVVNAIGQLWVGGVNLWNQLWFNFRVFVGEMLLGMLDGVSSFLNSAVNGFNSLKFEASKVWYDIASAAGNMATAIAQGIDGMINSVISGIEGMLNSVLSGVNDMIATLDKIPGVNIGPIGTVTLGRANYAGKVQSFTSRLTAPTPVSRGNSSDIDLGAGLRDSLAGMSAPKQETWENVDFTSGLQDWILNQNAPDAPEQWTADYLGFKDLGDAFNRGHDQGASWENQLGGLLDGFKDLGKSADKDMFADIDFPEVPDAPDLGGGKNPTGGKLDSIGEIEDDIEMSDETLDLIKDVANQKWQQNYITMTPTITTNIESIGTEQEYEDFIARFNDDVIDAVKDGAEGIPT